MAVSTWNHTMTNSCVAFQSLFHHATIHGETSIGSSLTTPNALGELCSSQNKLSGKQSHIGAVQEGKQKLTEENLSNGERTTGTSALS